MTPIGGKMMDAGQHFRHQPTSSAGAPGKSLWFRGLRDSPYLNMRYSRDRVSVPSYLFLSLEMMPNSGQINWILSRVRTQDLWAWPWFRFVREGRLIHWWSPYILLRSSFRFVRINYTPLSRDHDYTIRIYQLRRSNFPLLLEDV